MAKSKRMHSRRNNRRHGKTRRHGGAPLLGGRRKSRRHGGAPLLGGRQRSRSMRGGMMDASLNPAPIVK